MITLQALYDRVSPRPVRSVRWSSAFRMSAWAGFQVGRHSDAAAGFWGPDPSSLTSPSALEARPDQSDGVVIAPARARARARARAPPPSPSTSHPPPDGSDFGTPVSSPVNQAPETRLVGLGRGARLATRWRTACGAEAVRGRIAPEPNAVRTSALMRNRKMSAFAPYSRPGVSSCVRFSLVRRC